MKEVEHQESDEFPTRETSILFGRFAVWFLVACLIIAIWFKFLPLIGVTSFLLILSILIITWRAKSLKNLHLTLDIPTLRLFVGDEFKANASIQNDKWLPLIWLEWEFQPSHLIVWGEDQKDTYIARFLWLLSYQQVKWTVKGKANQRGVYPIGDVVIRSGDGFRFSEKERVIHLNKELYIYPKLIPVSIPPFDLSMQWEVQGKQGGFLEDPLLVSGIREYEPGDEWQRFNWRASARTGKMLTNVYQPIVSEQLIIALNVEGFVIDTELYEADPKKNQEYEHQKQTEFESFLSIIASFAVTFNETGVQIGYASNGRNHVGEAQAFITPRNSLTHTLDQLAQITQHVLYQKVSPLDEMIATGQRAVPIYIFCERIIEADIMWYERNRQDHAITFYYVHENTFSKKIPEAAEQIDQLHAETAVNYS